MEMATTSPFETTARELTDEEREQRAGVVTEIEGRIKGALAKGREALWELAQALYEFDQESGWSALGYESQEHWLAQPEISMTRVSYFRLIRRYKELVIFRQLPMETLAVLDPSKLDIVISAIERDEKPLQEIIDDVQQMGARDLREVYGTQNGAGERGSAPPSGGATSPAARSKELSLSEESLDAIADWLTTGGQRRKAQRHMNRLIDTHPFFASLAVVQACIDGGEDAPSKEEASQALLPVSRVLLDWR